MFGPKKTPSQSPYMRLLNRALSKSETNGDHGNYLPDLIFFHYILKIDNIVSTIQ